MQLKIGSMKGFDIADSNDSDSISKREWMDFFLYVDKDGGE